MSLWIRANNQRKESGATMVEYVMAASLLVIVVGAAVIALQESIEERGDRSAEIVEDFTPCGATLSGSECD